ncbi:hypothetical protein [Actinoplanes sp. NPDC051494]|uniref:hypothetical protein n=1 Tax=Actinoplanes sp. NPDC051494 TaxID=3363907 RepID=UPI0037A4165A
MDDLDRLLAESMRDAADGAPSDGGLLATVHQRSRRYHRRRIVTGLSAAAAVLALGIPFGAVLVTRSAPMTPSQGTVPAAPAPTTEPATSPAPSPSASASVSGSASGSPAASHTPSSAPPSSASATVVKLEDGYTAPVFPYTLPATDGMKAPVASMRDGDLIALFEATELRDHADTTVTVSSRKPVFDTDATQTTQRVRGHSGTLRTLDVEPARQLTLWWQESSSRWIQLATDDTYTPQEVVALATSLSAGAVAVSPPFTLDRSPAGLVADTVTASRMSFRAAGGEKIEVVLRKRRELTGDTVTVGDYQGVLTQGKLAVDVTDWDATLEVTVGAGLTMSGADLLRFAEGVHILNRSDPE